MPPVAETPTLTPETASSQTPGETITAISVEAATTVIATLPTVTPSATETVVSPTAEPDQAAPGPRATLALVIKTSEAPGAKPPSTADSSETPEGEPPEAEEPTFTPETVPGQTPSETVTATLVDLATPLLDIPTTEMPSATVKAVFSTEEADQVLPVPRATLALVIGPRLTPIATPSPTDITPTSLPPVAETPHSRPRLRPVRRLPAQILQTPSGCIPDRGVDQAANSCACHQDARISQRRAKTVSFRPISAASASAYRDAPISSRDRRTVEAVNRPCHPRAARSLLPPTAEVPRATCLRLSSRRKTILALTQPYHATETASFHFAHISAARC